MNKAVRTTQSTRTMIRASVDAHRFITDLANKNNQTVAETVDDIVAYLREQQAAANTPGEKVLP